MLSTEEVKKVANLARLDLTEDEEERFAGQISGILDYVGQLQQSGLSGDVSLEAGQSYDDLRQDESDGGRYQADILSGAPKSKNGLFIVPPVFGE